MTVSLSLKTEILKAPLQAAIGVIALLIALFGSPFAKGTWLNPIEPRVVPIEQYSMPNDQYGVGKFATNIIVENKENIDASIEFHMLILDKDKELIKILNNETDESTKFLIYGNAQKQVVGTSNKRPHYVVTCANIKSEDSWAKANIEGVYILMGNDITDDSILSYSIEKISEFKAQIDQCNRYLSLAT